MILKLLVILLLIGLSAIFSSTETAYTSLSFLKLQEIVKKHGRPGRLVKQLSERPNILLTTILIGNNLVNIAASALATQLTIELFGNRMVGIMTGVLTLVILIFAEVTPKQLAILHSDRIALRMAYPIRFLSILLYPFIKLIGFVSLTISSFFSPEEKAEISLEGIL